MEREELNQKVRVEYQLMQRDKLQNDFYYNKLRAEIEKVITYTVPVIIITNGFTTQELPQAYHQLAKHMEEYIDYAFPVLSNKENIMQHRRDLAYFDCPERLSLSQIDKRLSLYTQYLEYYLNDISIFQWTNNHLEPFQYETLTFDEWLYNESYRQLTKIHWNVN